MTAGQHVALPVIGGLAVAYLDRIASGDTTRAAIVLTSAASVWPSMRQDYIRETAEIGGLPVERVAAAVPEHIVAEWRGATRDVLVGAIEVSVTRGSSIYDAAEAVYDAAIADLRPRALALMNAIPASAPIRRYIRVASGTVSGVSAGLDAQIAGTIAEGSVGPAPPAPPIPPAPPARRQAQAEQQPITIVGSTATPTSSRWPFYVAGGALAIGLIVFAGIRLSRAAAAT